MNRLAPIARTHTTAPTPKATPAPKGYAPGIEYENGRPAYINTPPAPHADSPGDYQAILDSFGWPLPDGARLELVSAAYDPAAWHRDQPWTDDPDAPYRKTPAVTRAVWRYRFRVTYDHATITTADLDAMVAIAQRGTGKRTPATPKTEDSYVVCLSDLQLGKGGEGDDATDGYQVTVQRALDILETIAIDIRKVKPAEIVLLDVGDAIESCQNTSTQARTNSLDMIDQLRVWQRILMRYIKRLSPLAPSMTVAGVPSNHGRFRLAPKTPASGPWDDYGLLAISNAQDAVELGLPGADIKFAYPKRNHESLTIETSGTRLGVFHGHQANSPDRVPDWIGKQAAGRQPLMDASVLVSGHYHNFQYRTILGDRKWLQCPTLDVGSSWYTRASGEWSAPGVLVFRTSNDHLYDVKVL